MGRADHEGAQRLAASEVLAAAVHTGRLTAISCSTPCGIRGFGRCNPVALPPHPLVLNALRHQRFWQPTSRLRPSTPGSAQRLAASEVLAGEDNMSVQITTGAQRLAASEVLAAQRPRRPEHRMEVLNALRHQRFWQTEVSTVSRIPLTVLNALRHQRFWQTSRRGRGR